jgi:O-antigen ligase
MQAHSAWVKTLTENGIPGVVLLIAYVFSFAAIGIRRGGRAKALGFLTTAVLIVAFTWTEFANKGLWLLVSATTVLINPVRIYR